VTVNQQTHHPALGDADPDGVQLRRQPLHGDLPLVVLQQHEAAQLRTGMAADSLRWPRRPDCSLTRSSRLTIDALVGPAADDYDEVRLLRRLLQ
jgi:hypothetical protein